MTGHDLLPPEAPLPWLTGIWSRLRGSREADRVAHGLLVSGPSGVGKRHLVELYARSLLCHTRGVDGMACGRCSDCSLLAAGSHPDLIRVGPDPESRSGEIPIGAIRNLSQRESLTPSRAQWKVAIIDPADRLNPAAANALLKTLEEPAGQTLLCLVGERLGQLPATIRSRCQQIKIPVPGESEALEWLKEQGTAGDLVLRLRLAHGAPLRARCELDETLLEQRRERLDGFLAVAAGSGDPVREAAAWNQLGAPSMLDWLAGWLCDILRLMITAEPARLDNPDRRADFARLARAIEPAAGHRFLQRILEARALAETNLNQLLQLESLAIEWSRIGRGITIRDPDA